MDFRPFAKRQFDGRRDGLMRLVRLAGLNVPDRGACPNNLRRSRIRALAILGNGYVTSKVVSIDGALGPR
jgi:hypothetical protein